MFSVFLKIKIDDDGKISFDESYNPTPVQVSEDGITAKERDLYGIPDDYMVGETEADGSCFLNSFLIGLQASGEYHNLSMAVLRAICAHEGRELPPWLAHVLANKHLSNNYTQLETPADFVNRVLYDDSWGEPEIEGRILCGYFSVNVYILETNGKRLVTGEGVSSVIDVEFYRPKTLYFINRGRYHYEPLLPVNSNNLPIAATPAVNPSSNTVLNTSKSKLQHNFNNKDFTSTQLSAEVTCSSPVEDLPITPELKQILEAIKAKKVIELEEAFINYQSVQYKSTDVQLITLSLKEALLSSDIQILDLVYEHWATAAHLSLHRIYNLKSLTKAMISARNSCLEFLKHDRQMLVAEHCLVAYNNFRIQICRELIDIQKSADFDDPIDKRQQIFDVLIIAIDTYKEFSDKKIILTDFKLIEELLYDTYSNEKNELYRMYILQDVLELYHSKLDTCMTKMILDYIDSMEPTWKLPERAFRDAECAIYYYINRVKDDWQPCVRDKILKLKYVVFDDFYDFLMNPNRVFNCLAICLERISFIKAMDRFRIHLKYASKITYYWEPDSDINRLTFLPSLRDKYSLEKIVLYLKRFSQILQRWESKDCLVIIGRVLKVLCECFGYANPLRLSPLTQAILNSHIPRDVLLKLEIIKENLSQVSNTKLLRRIDIDESYPNLLLEVANDIDQFKSSIIEVIELYKPVLEKHFYTNGLNLVKSSINEMLYKNILDDFIHELLSLDKNELIAIINNGNDFLDERLPKYGFTFKVFQTLVILILNTKHLKRELHAKKMNTLENIIKQLPTIVNYIGSILNDVEYNINDDEVTKNDSNNDKVSQPLKIVHCLLSFLGYEILPFTIKGDIEEDLLSQLNKIFNSATDRQKINNFRKLIVTVQKEYETIGEIYELNKSPNPEKLKDYKYKGIEKLTELLSIQIFLTTSEVEYLRKNISVDIYKWEPTLLSAFETMLKGIKISAKERDIIIKNADMNDRCKHIIKKLVEGIDRENCALQYLAKRATTLKNAIDGMDFTKLVQRYKVDVGFRLQMEALLQDINDVYCGYKIENHQDSNKSNLFKNHLHDFLDLTNPILEVIVETNSRLALLFRFACHVVEDEPVLTELWKLKDDGLDREEVKRKWSSSDLLYLQDYLKLLPQNASAKQTTEESRNSLKDNSENVLLDSFKSDDAEEPPSKPVIDSTKSVQALEIAIAPSGTSIFSGSMVSISTLSSVISSASEAAQAAASASAAASTAAQAAARASAALVLLITSANSTHADDQKSSG